MEIGDKGQIRIDFKRDLYDELVEKNRQIFLKDKTRWFAEALQKEFKKKYGDNGKNEGAKRDISI